MPQAVIIPAEGPEFREIEDGLDALQQLVGGNIEALPIPEFIRGADEATAYVNEDGKDNPDCRPNMRATDLMVPGVGILFGDYVAGTMVLLGFDITRGEHTPTVPQALVDRAKLIAREAGDVLTYEQDATFALVNDRWPVAQYKLDSDGVLQVKLDDGDKTTIEPDGSCPLIGESQ